MWPLHFCFHLYLPTFGLVWSTFFPRLFSPRLTHWCFEHVHHRFCIYFNAGGPFTLSIHLWFNWRAGIFIFICRLISDGDVIQPTLWVCPEELVSSFVLMSLTVVLFKPLPRWIQKCCFLFVWYLKVVHFSSEAIVILFFLSFIVQPCINICKQLSFWLYVTCCCFITNIFSTKKLINFFLNTANVLSGVCSVVESVWEF